MSHSVKRRDVAITNKAYMFIYTHISHYHRMEFSRAPEPLTKIGKTVNEYFPMD